MRRSLRHTTPPRQIRRSAAQRPRNPPASNPTVPKSVGQQPNKKRGGNSCKWISSPLFSSALVPQHSRLRLLPVPNACSPSLLTRPRCFSDSRDNTPPDDRVLRRPCVLFHRLSAVSVQRQPTADELHRQTSPANSAGNPPPTSSIGSRSRPATAGGPSRRGSPLSRSGPSRPAHGAPAR